MRLKDDENNALNDGKRPANVLSVDEIAVSRSEGITLVEVLVAITTVGVLIAMLLPVIQRKREEYAANKATQNITAMLVASNEYFKQRGFYPNDIRSLFAFCDGNPRFCSLDPQLATGSAGGYNVIMANTEGDFHIIAEPTDPGITGSVTLRIGPDVMDSLGNPIIISTPTPGSDAARQRAFDDILASGANAVAQLLALDLNAASQIRAYIESPDTPTNAFNTVDANQSGDVSISEINTFANTAFDDEALKRPLKSWLDRVYLDLRLDTLSEQDRQNIAVTMGELDTTKPLLISYQGLRNLTIIDWGDGSPDDAIAKLNAAEAAEANGNFNRKAKFLKQYRKIIKQGAGTLLTSANANTLTTISATL